MAWQAMAPALQLGANVTENATTRKRILVVNDTMEILELFQEIIEGMGHEFVGMSYAPDDLAKIADAQPDLAVVDFIMGGQEFRGWQLLQKMKMSRATRDIPMIACTGAKREVYEQEGWLTEKGIAIVLKPFDIEELERAITKALDLPVSPAAAGSAG
jgi:CheY-like chemotaxis protein